KPTKYLRGSLGIRSLFFSTYLYDDEPNYTFRDLPRIARDALDHGLRELNIWFLFEAYFEFPMKLNPKLGTADELKAALAECREAFLTACRELHRLGFSSVSYDQLFADRLCYGDHGHAPQEVLAPLYDLVRQVHREGQAVDPDASLSGEFFNDVSQTFQ